MTVQELAVAAGRDVNQVLEAISYSDPGHYSTNSIIHNRLVLSEAVRRLGAKFKVINKPTKEVEEEVDHDVTRR